MLNLCGIACPVFSLLLFACGTKEERKTEGEKGKGEKAAAEAITKEFKLYEGAKTALEKVEKEAQERRRRR